MIVAIITVVHGNGCESLEIAGGKNKRQKCESTVEVMDLDKNLKRYLAHHFRPLLKLCQLSAAICNDHILYIYLLA